MTAHYGDMKAQLEITAFFPRLFLFVAAGCGSFIFELFAIDTSTERVQIKG